MGDLLILVAPVIANVLFIVSLILAYLFVARRRAKIYMLVEHLASLARQGLPLHTGLKSIAQDLGGFFGTRVARVAEHVEEGRPLGEAFQAAPRTFPPILRAMMLLGWKSGNLAPFMEETRRSYQKLAELPYQSVYLFIYPIMLSLCINLMLTAMAVGIVPKFELILEQMDAERGLMAWWTRIIFANEVVLALSVALVFVLLSGGTSIHFGSSVFRFLKGLVDRLILRLPLAGAVVRDGSICQWTLSTGLLLRAGAPVPQALKAAAEAERNRILRRRLEELAARTAEGAKFSEALRQARPFPDDLVWFVETGEAAGCLPDHLLMAATHYETRVRFVARMAARSVVPIFVVLNGVLVLGVFALTFLPQQRVLRTFLERLDSVK